MSAGSGAVRACIGLGANLGQPERSLDQAARALAARLSCSELATDVASPV